MCGDQHVVASFKSLYKNRIERCGHQSFSEFSLHCPNHAHGPKFDPDSQNCQNTFCRDRMARDCTIRHPVWPIAALQRRMGFSARLAGFCRGRCHQRRARRAEQAAFSVLVSNRDFRVPRLRQRGERAADRAVQRRKRGRPRFPESRPGLPRRSRLARSGPGAARAWTQVSARERDIPLLDGVFPARTGNPNRRHRLRHAPDLGLATGRRASLEFVCVFGQDASQSVQILRNSTQNTRSTFESRGRFTERRRTASCCRRATFSRASSRRALKAEMRAGTNDEIMPAWCWQTGD